MNMNARYGILSDAETGAVQQPACWQDKVAYYIYLVGQGRVEESQKLLVESLAGKKTSTKILEHSPSSGCADKFSH